MPIPDSTLVATLLEAGYEPRHAAELLAETRLLFELAAKDNQRILVMLLEQRVKVRKLTADLEVARRESRNAVEAAGRMEALLDELLEQERVLARLEAVQLDGFATPRVLCQMNGSLHLLPIHPEVDPQLLEGLRPWDAVAVAVKERVVVDIVRDANARDRAHGDVASFQGWIDRPRGLARVQRSGHEESVVRLVDELRSVELLPGDRLVLLRGDAGWAIAQVGIGDVRGRFEVPLGLITTRLDDLAGMDEVKTRLLEAIHARIDPESARFGLKPLRGVLLLSFKPGMGKTALVRALARHLAEVGQRSGFDVVLHVVQPGALKSMWHGGDARLVREELFGSIRARIEAPRTRPLFQLVAFDEVESIGRRSGGDDGAPVLSAAQNDAVQSLLAEMDGVVPLQAAPGAPAAHVFLIGMSNRPDLIDDALKRPDRMGDDVIEMPDPTLESAEGVCAIHLRHAGLPWLVDGSIATGLSESEVRERFVRPALARVFQRTILHYATDARPSIPVSAGEVVSHAHCMQAMDVAKRQAAKRSRYGLGVPAVRAEDVLEALVGQAASAARQLDADRRTLARHLRLRVPVTRVECVPEHEFLASCTADA